MKTCESCKANKICDHNRFGFENCDNFIPADDVLKNEIEMLQAEIRGYSIAKKYDAEHFIADIKKLEIEIKALCAFKDYFSNLYGEGLEIANWHKNGDLELFDNFYESAINEYEAELKKKHIESDKE